MLVYINPNCAKAVQKCEDMRQSVAIRHISSLADVNSPGDTKSGESEVTIFGGDGTIHRLLQSARANYPKFALVACGTSNGVASSVASSILGARSSSKREIPIMEIRGDLALTGILSVGWGLIADFDNIAERKTRWLGFMRPLALSLLPAYIIACATQYHGVVTLDDFKLDGTFQVVHICNLEFLAHDFLVIPKALQKPELAILVIRNASRLDLIRAFQVFGDVARADNSKLPDSVKIYYSQKVRLHIREGSILVDGESGISAPATVDILRSATSLTFRVLR